MQSKPDKKGFWFVIRFSLLCASGFLATGTVSDLAFNKVYTENKIANVNDEDFSNLALVGRVNDREKGSVTIGFVGDIMLDRGVENVVEKNGGDFKFAFSRIADNIDSIDLLFGNLEGSVSDKGRELGALYSFRMNPKATEALKYAGFDALSLSNNHAGDWGNEALMDAIDRIEKSGIGVVGVGRSSESVYEPLVIETGGLSIGFLSFTESAGIYNGSKVAMAMDEKVRTSVSRLKESGTADFIVVHFHFGDEYKKKANERQKRLAHAAIDTGADLVVGSHPHVTQGFEKYGEGYIFYSLGNFVFDQYFSEETMQGWLLKAHVDSGGEVEYFEICTTIMTPLFQPVMGSCSPLNF